jgi:hypothetical protein
MLPFGIGARTSSRFSFTLPTTTLGAASVPLSPVQIPAVGYLKKITLEITLTGSGGTTPTFTADAPFNLLSLVELRNSSGNDLIVPVTGYQLFLLNKYGVQGCDSPECDPKADQQYSSSSPSAHFFLDIPCEIAPADQFGSIPALASNRSYQLAVNLNAQANVTTSNPTLTVSIVGTAWFYTEPVASTMNGVAQQTAPPFNGSLNLWQLEPVTVSPGDKYIRSNNTGNVLRELIFVLRTAAGARTDVDWPALCELYLDNNPMFYLPQNLWQSWMSRVFGFQRAAAKDGVGTLDTGVYVIPFFALAEGSAIANARRSQYLPTLDASQLQIRGTSWGAAASTLEIITNSVQPSNPANGNSASALYALS